MGLFSRLKDQVRNPFDFNKKVHVQDVKSGINYLRGRNSDGTTGDELTYDSTAVDEEIAAIRAQTEAMRAAIAGMQQADLSARAEEAEQARSAMDTVLRLSTGTGTDPWAASVADRRGRTLLSRVPGKTLNSARSGVGQSTASTASTTSAGATQTSVYTPISNTGTGYVGGGSSRGAYANKLQ